MPLYETFKSSFSCKAYVPQNLFHFLASECVPNASSVAIRKTNEW